MSIRSKLLVLFFITLTILSGIGVYAVSVYREILVNERSVAEKTHLAVEYAHQAESAFHSQLNAWKNVLLRGNEVDNYHRYLQDFYRSERQTRKTIKELQDYVSEVHGAEELLAQLNTAHRDMGRKFREAIRLFNDTEVNPGQVTDLYLTGVEDVPSGLLNQIVRLLEFNRIEQLDSIAMQREQQEGILFVMILVVLGLSFALFVWMMDKNIVKPAERATHLADIIDNAQRVAKFGSWDWDSNEDNHYWSDGLYRILGLDFDKIPSQQQFLCVLNEEDRPRVAEAIDQALKSHSPFELEARVRLADGTERVVQQRGQVTKSAKDGRVRMTSIVYDITERKESENRLAYLANYDAVTGLPNRNLFQDRLKHAMAQAERSRGHVALLYLDLDHFKSVNDALGHQAGDKLLVEAAQRIKKHIRTADTAARLGGDEFTIVIEQFENNAQIAIVAEHVLEALNKSYQINNHEVFVSASMGITLFPDDGRDVETLLKNADSAMYLAKDQGRNTYHFFTEELNRKAQQRLHLENSLRMALDREEFQLHFQPQIELSSGRVVGAEALLRWTPGQDMISPARFIPVLEETGLILPVGEWVLEQACKTAVDIQNQGFADFRIAVNIAARQLQQADIVSRVQSILDSTGLSPEYLELELTESTLIDESISKKNLQKLEAHGIRLAIDDFGTGYSSLSYLKQYSVDVLKIDRSFINDISKDRDDDAVTSAIIALSHRLDMKVIAEGVETVEQLEFLKKYNCDQAQGFMIGRPMIAHKFMHWMKGYCDSEMKAARWNLSSVSLGDSVD